MIQSFWQVWYILVSLTIIVQISFYLNTLAELCLGGIRG